MESSDTGRAILAELRKLNSSIEQQSKEQRDQHKRDRRDGKRGVSSSDWVGLSIEFGVLTLSIAVLVGYSQWQSATNGQDGIVDKILGSDFHSPLKEGDEVAGYKITSGFGMRNNPVTGELKPHDGVDVATPLYTNLYFPFQSGSVECKTDPNGYGTYAILKPLGGSENGVTEILLGHLSKCQAGSYSFGNGVALAGDSGRSTGPHLHFEQHDSKGASQPTKGWLYQVLAGTQVLSTKYLPAGQYGGVFLDGEQTQNAAQIIQICQQLKADKRDIQIALMVALQESSLRNIDHGDDWWFDNPATAQTEKSDSKGLFQRRGGSTDIEEETRLFLERLSKVSDRQKLTLGQAAQMAQVSAFPNDYDKWETVAAELLQQGY